MNLFTILQYFLVFRCRWYIFFLSVKSAYFLSRFIDIILMFIFILYIKSDNLNRAHEL